ncbi:hypothetical protein BX666DRAFT_1976017 [Dichotomocladium elegans]|nr:hypothetical protein BX666DRAFT_1976017 [Dichotomocladium elegans]
MRALVPLDTLSVDDHVIQGPASRQQQQQQTMSTLSNHDSAEDDGQQQRKKAKPWIEWMKRQLLQRAPNKLSRRKSTPLNKSTIARPCCFSNAPSSSSVPQQPGESPTDHRRRHSSYDQYRDEKHLLIQQGLHRLSNPNIASALGVSPTDPYASCLAYHLFSPLPLPLPPSQQQQQQQPHRFSSIASLAHLKPDSGVSVLTKSLTQQQHSHPPPPPPQERARPVSMDSRDSGIVATRYPKMVSRRILRDAAIRALSSDMSFLGLHSTSSTSSLGVSACNNKSSNGTTMTIASMTTDPCCCLHHHHYHQQQQQQQQQDTATLWCCPPS